MEIREDIITKKNIEYIEKFPISKQAPLNQETGGKISVLSRITVQEQFMKMFQICTIAQNGPGGLHAPPVVADGSGAAHFFSPTLFLLFFYVFCYSPTTGKEYKKNI